MSEQEESAMALNVRLKLSDSSAHPHVTNYTNIAMAQGMAYLDFAFIEPEMLAGIAKTAKDGQAAPKGVEGHLVARVALDVTALARLQQQIQQVLRNLVAARQPKAKG